MPLALIALWANRPSLADIGRFLASPAGYVLIVALALLGGRAARRLEGGELHGRHVERAKAEARIEASIAEARKHDADVTREAALKMAQQQAALATTRAEVEKRISDYDQALKSRSPTGSCALDPDDIGILSPGGLRLDPLQRGDARSPARR
jgi:hypothetical protein